MNWKDYLRANQDRFVDELIELVAIPSVSALPALRADVRRAAEWLAARCALAGLQHAEVIETAGHPAVYADWLGAPGAPTIMVYGHFDVQPPDPLDKWVTPPFEPTIRDGRLYGRGASDDKGNIVAALAGIEAVLKTGGRLPVNLKCLFEGEEEIGSPTLGAAVAARHTQLAADWIVSCDGLQWSDTDGGVLVGLKGMCKIQIDVFGPSTDQHSGLYGAAIQNPLAALAHILAALRSAEGRVLVDGFYDNVRPLSAADRAQLSGVPFDAESVRRMLGVTQFQGEPGYTPLEHMWTRPTLDINGVYGGFQGEGSKTVVPAEAHAKITCRLVADQDPARIQDLIEAHVARHTPPGVRAIVRKLPGTAGAFLMQSDHPANVAIQRVLRELYGKPPHAIRLGGSIPVYGIFERELAIQPATLGFTLDDENLHAPNEFFRLASFERCQRAYAMLLTQAGT